MSGQESISAVIPTHQRPGLVLRALRSVLNQTRPPDQIVVAVDGPDQEAIELLQTVGDSRIKVVVCEQNMGNASARNLGVAHASGEWIAFLDDDDEWLANKLEVQMAATHGCGLRWPIVACRTIARTGKADLIWPRRLPRKDERLCDYLCRRSLPLAGEGLVQMSMILTRRELLQRVRFTDGLRRHVDPDWLFRAVREPGAGVIFPATMDPLSIWHIEQGRSRVSSGGDWRTSLDWVRSRRSFFTREAYAGFICKNVSALAAASAEPGRFAALLSEARRFGNPSWVDLASHIMNFTLTPAVRDTIWSLIQKLRPPGKR